MESRCVICPHASRSGAKKLAERRRHFLRGHLPFPGFVIGFARVRRLRVVVRELRSHHFRSEPEATEEVALRAVGETHFSLALLLLRSWMHLDFVAAPRQ